jgi:dihydrofolate reductase
MSLIACQITISLDGFAAGPSQSLENPLGEGGERLHEWVVATRSWRAQHGHEGGVTGPDDEVARANIGAYIMGRNMFGGGDGAWDESWRGWWGEEPPFHAPVFVLTHHEREPLELEDTTFTFVTEGVEAALEQARSAAGEQRVMVAGGASAVRQYLAAGSLDTLELHIVPVLLGGGARLLENLGHVQLEQAEVVAGPAVTHVTYRVKR